MGPYSSNHTYLLRDAEAGRACPSHGAEKPRPRERREGVAVPGCRVPRDEEWVELEGTCEEAAAAVQAGGGRAWRALAR